MILQKSTRSRFVALSQRRLSLYVIIKMSEQNPYTSPQAEVSQPAQGNAEFANLDFQSLKKLYHRSCNVNAITFLLGLGLIFLLVASFLPSGEGEPSLRFVFIGLAVFYAIAIFGLFNRSSWGRILGIIVCIISLINIPIGTLIGIFGLFAFFGSPQLFGAERVTHKALKAEFKLQKSHLKK